MATLVLTTVGTMIGGPVGGAIGALIGQAADARLFAPKGREGSRLSDLRVQTSSYGTPIPRLYGRMRVAGTVIWATDLVEHRHRQGGKGRPATTSYSYSASFAVALSARPIRSVGRIWAEGNILRGAAGDFKSATGFRLHSGDEDQPVDPLIAAAEGVGQCPAYRGLAYALFEDMDLSPFGNRIPSLSFEVEADEAGPDGVSLALPLADVIGAVEVHASLPSIGGAALSANSRREAIEPLRRLITIDRRAGASGWQLGEDRGAAALDVGEPAAERLPARPSRTLGDGGQVPRHIGLTLYDPARDWQMAVQQARVAGGIGASESLGLPLAMEAGAAKALTQRLAREAVRQVRRCDWPAGFAALAVAPGDAVLSGDGATGRLAERRIEGAGIRLIIEAERSGSGGAVAADGGRMISAPDELIGASKAWLFDLPWIEGMSGAGEGGSRLALAAAGEGEGWRQAGVSVEPSAGAQPVSLGSVAAASVLGEVVAIEGVGRAWLIDQSGAVTVELLHDDMLLANADDAALLGGANLAVAGDEVLQFGHAEPLGGRRWRLTRLLRGRFGTEDAMAKPAAGRGFALISDPALMLLPGGVQAGARVLVQGIADDAPLVVPIADVGRAQRPLAPVHLKAQWQADGGLLLDWVRRSRLGAGWNDLVDAPLDERDERYAVTLSASGNAVIQTDTVVPRLIVTAVTVAGWRAAGGSGAVLHVAISQCGTSGLSVPLTGSFAL